MKMDGFVYFIAAGDAIKIGYSKNVRLRFQTLQTASAVDLVLLGHVPGDVNFEQTLHERLAPHRRRGEWFQDCSTVRDIINETLGHDAFEQRPSPPCDAAPSGPSQREIAEEELALASERLAEFGEFCMGCQPDALVNHLPTPQQHLVLASFAYVQRRFMERVDFFLNDAQSPEDSDNAFHEALALAEMAEVHVRMICGDDVERLLKGWPGGNVIYLNLEGNVGRARPSAADGLSRGAMAAAAAQRRG
jgi:hypothetical protein